MDGGLCEAERDPLVPAAAIDTYGDYLIERGTANWAWIPVSGWRFADVAECAAGSGGHPAISVAKALMAAERGIGCVWSVRRKWTSPSTALLFFGAVGGSVWLLGAPLTRADSKAILRHAPAILDKLLAHYGTLRNEVWGGNTLHIKWLKKLGAAFGEPYQRPNGEWFHPFVFTYNKNKEDPACVNQPPSRHSPSQSP